MNQPAVELRNVCYRYGDRVALAGVTLDVRPGEIFALVGPNGSGKSTLFKLLSTLVPPQVAPQVDAGTLKIFGIDVAADPDSVRKNIGVVFQQPALDKQLTVLENLRYHARLYGMSTKAFTGKAVPLLKRFGIADRADERVLTLSGGMRRKVEIAKAVLTAPKLLLMDEPSTGVDVGARRELFVLLRELRDTGITILLTTHIMEEAAAADRVALLHQGKLIANDTPDALTSTIKGDVITLDLTPGVDPQSVIVSLRQHLGINATIHHDTLRIEHDDARYLLPKIIEAVPGDVSAVSLRRPTLEDVFVAKTSVAKIPSA